MRRPPRMRPWTLLLGWIVLPIAGGANDPAWLAWPAGPLEVHVAFNGPFDSNDAKTLIDCSIRSDPEFRSIDDLQTARTGRSKLLSSFPIRIAAARLMEGNRTAVLSTDPHPRECLYRLTRSQGVPQVGTYYDLTGVEAAWTEENGDDARPSWSGWWPVLDPDEARRITAISIEHERGFAMMARPGRLTLRTLITLPKGKVSVDLTSNGLIEATSGAEEAKPDASGHATLPVESTGDAADLSVTLKTGIEGKLPTLRLTYRAEKDEAEHPLTRARLTLPWAPPPISAPPALAEPPFDLSGGDRARGEAIFRGDEAKCSACHKVRGQGGEVGPDLSDLVGKPRLDVFRDIYDPSNPIRPDYQSYTVATRSGRIVVGTVRAEGADTIRVTDTEAKVTVVRRDEIEQLQPSPASIMPVGLIGVLGEDRTRDLLSYLTSPPAPGPPRAP